MGVLYYNNYEIEWFKNLIFVQVYYYTRSPCTNGFYDFLFLFQQHNGGSTEHAHVEPTKTYRTNVFLNIQLLFT